MTRRTKMRELAVYGAKKEYFASMSSNGHKETPSKQNSFKAYLASQFPKDLRSPGLPNKSGAKGAKTAELQAAVDVHNVAATTGKRDATPPSSGKPFYSRQGQGKLIM